MYRYLLFSIATLICAAGELAAQDPITLLGPNGGQSFRVGDTVHVTWRSDSTVYQVVGEISVDGGRSYTEIFSMMLNPQWGKKDWVIPESIGVISVATISDECFIKVRSYNNPNTYDESDSAFSIKPRVQTPVTIFWIGNSFTQYNDTPLKTQLLVNSGAQQKIRISDYFYSYEMGNPLSAHWANLSDTVEINKTHYDYVVLQDFYNPSDDTTRYYNQKFIDIIKRNSEIPMVAGIWPGKGSSSTQWFAIIKLYQSIADSNHVPFVPLATAWLKVLRDTKGSFPLYAYDLDQSSNDLIHPTVYSTYLNACVYYCVLTGESPVGDTFCGGVGSDTARYLQQKAWEVCDSMSHATPVVNLVKPRTRMMTLQSRSDALIINCSSLGGHPVLSIYSIDGALKQQLSLNATLTRWNYTGSNGKKLPAGRYVCRISGVKNSFTTAFIRIR